MIRTLTGILGSAAGAVAIAALMTLAPAPAALAGDGGEAGMEKDGGVVVVEVKNVSFEPAKVVIEPGTTVKWVNRDPIDHDVTSGTAVAGRKARKMEKTKFPDGEFRSRVFGKGKVFEHTFTEEGEYPYFCNLHPVMRGKVVVE